MSDALDKAEAAAREAAVNTAAVQIALAAVELAKAAQQQPAPHACQHDHKGGGRSAGEWLAIGGAVCVGSIGLAFASIALAIAACCATGCLLILRHLWNDLRKG
jgi:hypothetical protein